MELASKGTQATGKVVDWFLILGEEVGEVASAINDEKSESEVIFELIDVAAVAVATVEELLSGEERP